MRNTVAHTPVPFSAAEAAQNGDEPATSGGSTYGYGDNTRKLRNKAIQRVPEHLEATREVPGHWRGSKGVGGALAAESRTGAEEEEEDKAAWAKLT